MQNVSSNLSNVKDKMKGGLDGVNTGVGDTQKHSENKQEAVKEKLEGIVNNQVTKLLDEIKLMNEANAKQQAKNQEEMQGLKDTLKNQLDEIKKDNKQELGKIKEDLVKTMDEKTKAAKVKNDDSAKQLKSEIQDVLEVMNKKLVAQTDG